MKSPFKYSDVFASSGPSQVGIRPKAKYDFGTAYPSPDSIPIEGLSQAFRTALLREGRDLALYPHHQGHPELRDFVAQKLERDRGIANITGNNIVIDHGSGRVNYLLFQLMLNPGDIVLTEDFVYLGTLLQLDSFKASVVGIPTDADGMITTELDKVLEDLSNKSKKPKFIYTIPAYQNPLGMNLSTERRKDMLQISEKYGVPILEDECYADLQIEGKVPRALRSIDESGRTIYVGSFSKIIGPGARLGYAVLPEDVMGRYLGARQDGGPNQLASLAILEYSKTHLEDHINTVNEELRTKRDAMLSALGENFPPSCHWSKPDGGLYIWLELPLTADAATLQNKSAEEEDIRYLSGNLFSTSGQGRNCLRLCYGYNTHSEITEGIGLLARFFDKEGILQ